jgi:GR25 family glycosyltransferase involved in LPS biosynthesis
MMVYNIEVTSIPIFVITDEAGRQQALTNLLKAHELKFRIAKAVFFERPPSTYNPKRSYLLSRRRLSLRELGCAQAHQNVYETIIREDISLALILEEDAKVLDARLLLQSIKIILDSNCESGFIASYYSENAEISRNRTNQTPWRRCYGFPSGAVAYLIDKEAANILTSYNSNLDFAADWPPAKELSFFLKPDRIISHSILESKIEESRRLNSLSILVKLGNLIDLLLFTRFIRLKRMTDIRFRNYLTRLYFPVFFRILRKTIRFSDTRRSEGSRKNFF